jgi:hypothetical protein
MKHLLLLVALLLVASTKFDETFAKGKSTQNFARADNITSSPVADQLLCSTWLATGELFLTINKIFWFLTEAMSSRPAMGD